MANPPTAKPFDQVLDPSDALEFYVYLRQGAPDSRPAPLLLPGEAVASYSLALTAEAAAVGLRIMLGVSDGGDRTDRLDGNRILVWHNVAPELRASPVFDGPGVVVGVEVTIVTTAVPSRTEQRTYLVPVANG